MDSDKVNEILQDLSDCILCPRMCRVNRLTRELGYCRGTADFHISSICVHRGEEPVISGNDGICNVFFARCNLQCTFCQNYQISRKNAYVTGYGKNLEQVVDDIISILDTGIGNVGFVSPTHYLPQMKAIIASLNERGRFPVIVYNTNAYDRVEELQKLKGLVDVYLPDFKYMDRTISKLFSDAGNYPEVALKAIDEMYKQVGEQLVLDNNGKAKSGLVIRHLVLPGHIENSKRVLSAIFDKWSNNIAISLMSQYYPVDSGEGLDFPNNRLTAREYNEVIDHMAALGFENGWIQDLTSYDSYLPDFENDAPFVD